MDGYIGLEMVIWVWGALVDEGWMAWWMMWME